MFPDFLYQPVDEVARRLLGCVIERKLGGHVVRLRIVETEAYDQDDEASHAYGGERKRNAVMFREAGHLYVYFTYGMHYCCNVVTGAKGHGSGVLIRALEPIPSESDREGLGLLGENRGGKSCAVLTNGPGKLTQALAIDGRMNGHDMHNPPLRLFAGKLRRGESVVTTPRIGISKARDAHRRFIIDGNPYLSR